MKTQLKISLLALSLTALLYGGGCTPDLLPIPMTTEYAIIDGDTVKTVVDKNSRAILNANPHAKMIAYVGDTVIIYRPAKLHTPKGKPAEVSNLKRNPADKSPLHLVAVGGSLMAGVRDGGYFNEGMETAFANLLAIQLGAQFSLPKFPVAHYNGTGRLARTTYNPIGGPVPKYKFSANNMGIEKAGERLSAVPLTNIREIDNYAIPFVIGLALKPDKSKKEISKSVDHSIYNRNKSEEWGFEWFENKEFDFFIIENGINDILYFLDGGNSYSMRRQAPLEWWDDIDKAAVLGKDNAPLYGATYASGVHSFVKEASLRSIKGCILNAPDPYKFPLYRLLPGELAMEVYKKVGNYTDLSGLHLATNNLVDSLLSPKVNLSLKPFISYQPVNGMLGVNQSFREELIISNTEKELLAKRYNLPLVDLFTLYEEINAGKFISHDGIRVDPTFDTGNFYSADGVFPTPFGNAIIANEVIRTINAFYKTNIELIPTREYLEK